MTNCGAAGCTNCSTKNTNLRLHRVPDQCLQNIKRKELLPKISCICSKHFEKDCFERDNHNQVNTIIVFLCTVTAAVI